MTVSFNPHNSPSREGSKVSGMPGSSLNSKHISVSQKPMKSGTGNIEQVAGIPVRLMTGMGESIM